MKKSIGLVIDSNRDLINFLHENIKMVLGNNIEINHYFISEILPDDLIDDDVILIMSNHRLPIINNNISDNKKVRVIKRTLREDKIYELFFISKGEEVLVVNDCYETTYETVKLFYNLGIRDINFIPYIEGNNYSHINIAITPGEIEKVPKHISKVIDMGHRCIDTSTFIEIVDKLKIDSKEIRSNLIKYSESVVSLETGIRNKYKELYLKIEELDTILNLSKTGIIFINKESKITTFNNQALQILNLSGNIIDRDIKELFIGTLKTLLDKEEIIDEVIEFNKKYINVNKKNIYNNSEIIGTYYNLQEITYIKKLEQNLTKKLRQKGHIAKYTFDDIYTRNNEMIEVINISKKVSKLNCSILITGESGTGKELIAQSIHNNSNRKYQPFIAVNCAAVPEHLLESELFGYEEGAFTGSLKGGKKGLFESANNGTIFLDEIGDMPLVLQTKLLRVLQEKQIMPIGSENVIDIDVRIIAATHRNIEKMIEEGTFREDLYYRLNVIPIEIPPLRKRKEDILSIMDNYLDENITLTEDAKEILLNHKWKGNIREVQNISLYINAMCDSIVSSKDLPSYIITNSKAKINIKLKYSIDDIHKILEVFYNCQYLDRGMGRGALLEILSEENSYITEGYLKKLLRYLNEEKLIISKVGRGGSRITPKGIKTYTDLKSFILE